MICPPRDRILVICLKYYSILVVLVHGVSLYLVSLLIQKITCPYCMCNNVIRCYQLYLSVNTSIMILLGVFAYVGSFSQLIGCPRVSPGITVHSMRSIYPPFKNVGSVCAYSYCYLRHATQVTHHMGQLLPVVFVWSSHLRAYKFYCGVDVRSWYLGGKKCLGKKIMINLSLFIFQDDCVFYSF